MFETEHHFQRSCIPRNPQRLAGYRDDQEEPNGFSDLGPCFSGADGGWTAGAATPDLAKSSDFQAQRPLPRTSAVAVLSTGNPEWRAANKNALTFIFNIADQSGDDD